MVLIDKENEEHNHISIINKMKYCWDRRLADALLIKAKDEKLKPKCMGCLLGELLDNNFLDASTYAVSLISLPPPSSGEERARAIVAAYTLINRAEDAGWSIVWPAIQQDTEFGREVITAVAHGESYRASIGQKLTEDQLADLYIWLVKQFPYEEDPNHDDAYWVGPRESVTMWRDSVLNHLKHRGTQNSIEAIQWLARELPELDWLKWTLFEARNITRRSTWIPPRPADILKLTNNQKGRLVQNGDQLLNVLIESLKRLEAKLQGETPAAIDLWNEISKNVYRPRDENRFSDYVKRHLDEDLKQTGVIVNREVEIRRGEGTTPGERTDIHVDAIIRDPDGKVYDSVTAIIEVKGCWNQDLDYAMETQLVNRYLKDNHCQHGLYLLGWFNCDQWDEKDYRKGQSPELNIDEAQKQFDTQAAEISQQGLKIKAFVINTALR